MKGFDQMRQLIALSGSIAAVFLFVLAMPACGEDDCLVDQENCSAAYVEAEYGDGRGCCGGLRCSPGAISGVPICQ